MPVQRINPDEAATLLSQGWKYVDVRSVPEFEQGHPQGAYNVPLMHQSGGVMTPNPEFAAVFAHSFGKDEQIVVGCRSGARSLRAAELLHSHGYQAVVDMRGGWVGEAGPGGAMACPGWQARGLPTATHADPGHTYAELKAKAP